MNQQIFQKVARVALKTGVTAALNQAARYVRVRGRSQVGLRPRPADTYQVLMYHRVNAEQDPFSVAAVHPRDFEDQVVFLKRHYNVLSLEELWRRVQDRTLPPNAVAITFDDGYRDNHDVALPILRKHRVPATLFLATDVAARREPLWYDRVLQAFKASTRDRLDCEPLGFRNTPLGSVAARQAAARQALAGLRNLGDADRRQRQDELMAALGVSTGDPGTMMMTWDELRALERDGFAVEAHTVTHPIMSRLDVPAARAEAVSCKQEIENQLQKQVRFFAYPNGKSDDFTDETKRVLREAGYLCAFSTVPTKNGLDDDPFALGRATPWFDDLARFALLQARINLGR